MGRWTPSTYDHVLVSKIENLVSGAIRRSKLEDDDGRCKHQITYSTFVESLDEGDSFTAALFEILVKELADRQNRSSAEDKRFVTKRTVDSLHGLAVTSRVYTPANGVPYDRTQNRSRLDFEDWFNGTDRGFFDQHDSLDEEEMEEALRNEYVPMEGARIDATHLYDVYRPPRFPVLANYPYPRNVETGSPSRSTQDDRGSELNQSSRRSVIETTLGLGVNPPTRLPPMRPFGSSTSLNRQASLRRPTRARAIASSDFNDFATRRRLAQRNNLLQDAQEASALSHSSSVGMLRPISPAHRTRSPGHSAPVIPPPPTEGSVVSEPASPTHILPMSSLFAPPDSERSSPAPESSRFRSPPRRGETVPWDMTRHLPHPHQPYPRLRRGGVLPPESILERRSSLGGPAPETMQLLRPEGPDGRYGFEPILVEPGTGYENGRAGTSSSSDSSQTQSQVHGEDQANSLPTPRSISPRENTP